MCCFCFCCERWVARQCLTVCICIGLTFSIYLNKNKNVSNNINRGSKGLWNLREAINLHYKKHILLLIMAVGYSVCYSMVVVAEIRDELKDLRQRVGINPGSLDCKWFSFFALEWTHRVPTHTHSIVIASTAVRYSSYRVLVHMTCIHSFTHSYRIIIIYIFV